MIPRAEIVVTRSLVKRARPPKKEEIVEAVLEAAPAVPKFVATDDDLAPMFFEEPTPALTQEELDAERARLEELREIMGVK
jgi:hypothetical protein